MVLYHASLRSLRDSAASGCDLCHLCWTSVKISHRAEAVESVLAGQVPGSNGEPLYDERVWLTGSFTDGGRTSTSKPNAPHPGSEIYIDCGNTEDPEATVSPSVLHSRLDVFADPGTPAASRFNGRLFTQDRNPDGPIALARALLKRCQSEHEGCGPANPQEMPTRVIDVGSSPAIEQRGSGEPSPGSVRLVLTRGLREPYLALSYCWGHGVRHATELNDGNHEALLESVGEDALTKTHRETIFIARSLGIRYVWIDSLCIIQGNLADWDYESKRMAQVYRNAALTVIAGRSADSREGFLPNRLVQAAPPCSLPFGGKDEAGRDIGDVFVSLPRSQKHGPVELRGWCFQEMLLSSRMLTYAAEQICFSCPRSTRWEDGTLTAHDSYQLRAKLFRSLPDSTDADQRQQLRIQTLQLWYKDIFDNYTSRELTNPHDIFAAISSVAQLARKTIDSRYLAGLWETDIIRGLLWYTFFSIFPRAAAGPRPKRPAIGNKRVIRAPSWSWASVQGKVYYRRLHSNEPRTRDPANFLVRPKTGGPTPRWTVPGADYCDADVLHMPRCELELFGRPKRVRCMPVPRPASHPRPLGRWSCPWSLRILLAREGYTALVEPAESEYAGLADLGLGDASSSSSPDARTVAVAVFDVCEERIADCWILPLLRGKFESLLLRKDADGKFHRLGLVPVVNDLFLPWLASGTEEEVHLV
ncbi:HET-domain-containing protein [Xylariaceae sp. FL0662B]|nr:HET-domain-containing protein [Xylariaceae sp. FL0662B]